MFMIVQEHLQMVVVEAVMLAMAFVVITMTTAVVTLISLSFWVNF